jgi:hypothetical protein
LKVLIFTEDQKFRELMGNQFQFSSLDFRFACWDYECSFIIESFRPQYVIVDGQAGQEKYERLRWHLSNDPRIPGVKVVMAGSFTERADNPDKDAGTGSSKNEHGSKLNLWTHIKDPRIVEMLEHGFSRKSSLSAPEADLKS